jgi:protein tyrosine/serine phosphatase
MKGHIIALGMDFNYKSKQFSLKLQKGFKFMLEHDGPYLIHCLQGIDRTGFMVMILEMLMCATNDEIVNEYMISFLGRRGFENGSKRYQNEKNNFIKVFKEISSFKVISTKIDFVRAVEYYLINEIGMTESDINNLKDVLK